jgi:hypothetical protein
VEVKLLSPCSPFLHGLPLDHLEDDLLNVDRMGVGGGVEELPDLYITHSGVLGKALQGDFRHCPQCGASLQ